MVVEALIRGREDDFVGCMLREGALVVVPWKEVEVCNGECLW